MSRAGLRVPIRIRSTLEEEARTGQEDFQDKPVRINRATNLDLQLQQKKIQTPAAEETSEIRNRLIDINILFPALEELLICSQCHGKVQLGESEAQGFGFKIKVVCIECGQLATINSCRKVGVKNHAWENNRRAVVTFRALDLGHAGLSTRCCSGRTPLMPRGYGMLSDKSWPAPRKNEPSGGEPRGLQEGDSYAAGAHQEVCLKNLVKCLVMTTKKDKYTSLYCFK